MTEHINLVPKRRFKEFQNTQSWEKRKLEDEVEFYSGLTYSPANVVDNGGTLVLRSSNVKDGEIVKADNVYVSSEVVNSDNVKIGDVIVVVRNGSRSLIGKHAQIKEKMNNTVIGAFMTGVRSEQSAFINALLSTSQFGKEIEKNMGATINQITTGAFKKMQFMFPHRKEQKKIGEFFKHLDNLITLHHRKLEKTKALKSAYLSEMFPDEGESEPKLRFAGFTQAWERRKLGTIAEFNPKAELPETFEYVDLESVVGTEMIAHRGERKATAPSRAQRLARQGDLFYQTVRPYQKNNYLFEKPCNNYVFSTGYAQMRPYGDGYFLMSLVQNEQFVKAVLDRCTGTSYPAISSNDLEDMEVSIPLKGDEQIQIGRFFRSLDNLITLHQRKLEKLQNLKKAYLNEMFV